MKQKKIHFFKVLDKETPLIKEKLMEVILKKLNNY